MGRCCFLQDDTGLEDQAAFRFSDGKGLAVALAYIDVIPTLEQQLELDLTPLRRVAIDRETEVGWGAYEWDTLLEPDAERDAKLHTELTTLRTEMDAAWQPVSGLRNCITLLLTAIRWPTQPFPAELVTAIPCELTERNFVAQYLGENGFARDLAAVLTMLHWAELRGAERVRLLVR